jgi:MoaA/NifB/PqqE/SkfB family radical SAM enzyme
MTKDDLSFEDVKKVIDKLYSLGCRVISFFGGEPTLRKDFPQIVRYTGGKGMITHVSTNGTLLTPEYIAELGKSGIDVINLALDSVDDFQESHKDLSGNRPVLRNLLEAREKFGFEITVNFALTNKNYDRAVDTITLMNTLHIPVSISLIVRNTYSEQVLEKGLYFTTEEEKNRLCRVADEIVALKRKGYNIIDPVQYFEGIKKYIHQGLDWYCSAGEYYFSVDSDGRFQICSALPAESMSIFEIDSGYGKKIRELREKRLKSCKEICFSNCMYTTSYFVKNPFQFFVKELLFSLRNMKKCPVPPSL